MKLNAMFLRIGCILPDGMDLIQKQFGDTWMSVENATASALDAKIRTADWHFMWLVTMHSSWAFGKTADVASQRAILAALRNTEARFNAAELGLVTITKLPGFYIARVTLHIRQIQQHASLGLVDEMILRQQPA